MDIMETSGRFSTQIVLLADKLPRGFVMSEIGERMIESSEAVDNYLFAARKSQNRNDIQKFLERALGKANETLAWLDNLYESAIIDKVFYRKLAYECEHIVKMLEIRIRMISRSN